LHVPDDIVLAIDQGSSNTRCIAFDGRLRQLASAMRPVSTLRPAPGMVEHDPQELLAGALEAVAEARAGVGGDVAAVGIANQTESFVLWDAESGAPASAVVSWQDQRAAELCEAVSDRPGASRISEATGLTLDPTFSAPKLMWLFERDAATKALLAQAAITLDALLNERYAA
jgi:glycerol kinase